MSTINFENEENNPDVFLATTVKRGFNYILDSIGAVFFMTLMLNLYSRIFESQDVNLGALFFVILLSFFVYYVVLEYFLGRTPAKFLTQTRVVTIYGMKPNFMTIVGRTLCRLIPFEQFSFLGDDPIGWHDKFSNTRVVDNDFKTNV